MLAGGVPLLWAVSPLVVVVFPPAVFGGCPPPVPLSRVAASFDLSCLCQRLWHPRAWPTSRPTTNVVDS